MGRPSKPPPKPVADIYAETYRCPKAKPGAPKTYRPNRIAGPGVKRAKYMHYRACLDFPGCWCEAWEKRARKLERWERGKGRRPSPAPKERRKADVGVLERHPLA